MDSSPPLGIHGKLDAILSHLIGTGAYKPGPPMKNPPKVVAGKRRGFPPAQAKGIPPSEIKPLPNYVPGRHPAHGKPLPYKKGTPIRIQKL